MTNDSELIQIFISEAKDILENINQQLDKIRQNSLQKEPWAVILRELHTLKGSARMLALLDLNAYTHLLEEVVKKLYQQDTLPLDEHMNALQHAVDYMNYYIEELSKANILPRNEFFFSKLRQILASNEDKTTPFTFLEKINPPISLNTEKEISSGAINIRSNLVDKFSELTARIAISRVHIEKEIKLAHHLLLDVTKHIQLTQAELHQLQLNADRHLNLYRKNNLDEFNILEKDSYSHFHQLTQSLQEKISQVEGLQSTIIHSIRNAENALTDQKRVTKSLEEGLIRTKLISLEKLVPRLQRVVKQVSTELGKDVILECVKVEGQIDRAILEKLLPSIEHLLRNAVDHGIETPKVRKAIGKAAAGVIKLSLFRQGNEAVIQLCDDGKGIDINKIRKKAVANDLWAKDKAMSTQEAIEMITLPGFSTKNAITPISGQGVGLDVVTATVNNLAGSFKIASTQYIGTKCILRLPFTLSLNQALIFSIAKQYYALQLSNLIGLKRILKTELEKIFADQGGEIFYGKIKYPLVYLSQIMGEKMTKTTFRSVPIIFFGRGTDSIGIIVDKLMGSSEIVIKPPGPQLKFIKHISGLTLLGDNKIGFILDPLSIVASALKMLSLSREQRQDYSPIHHSKETKVLVIDDSSTIRHIICRLLKRHDFRPIACKNAKQAINLLQHEIPDIILLDVEMPEMDGYQLLEEIRASQSYQHIPIIMITSRASKKHQQKALALGANAYLTKPYLDEELISLIRKFDQKPL